MGLILTLSAHNQKKKTVLSYNKRLEHRTVYKITPIGNRNGLGAKGVVVSFEKEAQYLKLAASFFWEDLRLQLVYQNAHLWVNENKKARFDLIFADTWTGKFTELETVLDMVKPGGFYVLDDFNQQTDWPRDHQDKVILLMEKLKCQKDFYILPLDIGSGFMVLCRKRN